MKKLAIGCGIVVLLFGVAGAGVTYYLYRQVSSAMAQFAEFAQVPELERSVRNRSAFTPPSTGQITEQQIERLVRVQGSIRARLGERFAELEQRHKTLLAKSDATALDLPELFSLYRGLAATWMDGKRQQIGTFNEAGFSRYRSAVRFPPPHPAGVHKRTSRRCQRVYPWTVFFTGQLQQREPLR